MSKFKVGDKVLIEGRISRVDNTKGITCPYRIDTADDFMWCNENYLIDVSKTYEDGLNDAWELARKIENKMSLVNLKYLFNSTKIADILDNFTPQQALAKIEAYEESKAIKVGDVVECFSDYKGVVLDCDDELGTLDVFSENGCVEGLAFSDVKKTGRHIDIQHILEQIRGNE